MLIPASDDLKLFGEIAEQLTQLSGSILHAELDGKPLAFDTKADNSPVTKWDREIELAMRKLISRHFPTHGILGEEFESINQDSDYQWILDPIDGTDEFLYGQPVFGSIAALYYQGIAIAGSIFHPALNLGVSAAKGCGLKTRYPSDWLNRPSATTSSLPRIACSSPREFFRCPETTEFFPHFAQRFSNLRMYRCCFEYTSALLGMVDACIDVNVHLWDMAPLEVLAAEANLSFVDFSPSTSPMAKDTRRIVLGKQSTVEEICELLQQYKLLKK
ncbi:MAG: hypothetical protein PHC51_11790 [bacterium]|nr:hypothetical protein [bacterium]